MATSGSRSGATKLHSQSESRGIVWADTIATSLPRAARIPVLREKPKVKWLRSMRITGADASRAISRVPSIEPESTTIVSKSWYCWPHRRSRSAGRRCASLKVRMMTVVSGLRSMGRVRASEWLQAGSLSDAESLEQVPYRVLVHEFPSARAAVGVVGGEERVVHLPQRAVRRERLVFEDVQSDATQPPLDQRADQCPLIHERSSCGIDKDGLRFQFRKLRGTYQVSRGWVQVAVQAHEVRLGEQVVERRRQQPGLLNERRGDRSDVVPEETDSERARAAGHSAPDSAHADYPERHFVQGDRRQLRPFPVPHACRGPRYTTGERENVGENVVRHGIGESSGSVADTHPEPSRGFQIDAVDACSPFGDYTQSGSGHLKYPGGDAIIAANCSVNVADQRQELMLLEPLAHLGERQGDAEALKAPPEPIDHCKHVRRRDKNAKAHHGVFASINRRSTPFRSDSVSTGCERCEVVTM